MGRTLGLEDWGGTGERLVFAHANGIPPRAYGRLLRTLGRDFCVQAFYARSLDPDTVPDVRAEWSDLADDLCRALAHRSTGRVVGVGHSLGAVLMLMAASRAPSMFSSIVLIEPVAAPRWHGLLHDALASRLNPHEKLARGALRRRTTWPSRDAAFEAFRSRPVFASLSDGALADYVDAITQAADPGGVHLAFSRAWEAHLYACVPNLWPYVRAAKLPLTVVRAEHSNELSRRAVARWKRIAPQHGFVEIAGAGHLVPLERAEQTAYEVRRATQRSMVSLPTRPTRTLAVARRAVESVVRATRSARCVRAKALASVSARVQDVARLIRHEMHLASQGSRKRAVL